MKKRFITLASGSNRVTLPKHLVDDLGWGTKTPLKFNKVGHKLIISELKDEE